MPEGPSILILKEECAAFAGKKIRHVEGNSKAGIDRLQNQKIIEFKTWGKNFFICFKDFTVRIHLMLFGSYRINERKETPVRLSLQFSKGEINFYSCVVEIITEDLNKLYDWERDVLSPEWKPRKAFKTLKEMPDAFACDVLLDQHIFAGVGNIIKNEVLFRLKIHPLSVMQALPDKKLKELVKDARQYSFLFYEWKKKFELKKHWQAHRKKTCPRCNIPLLLQVLGKFKRRTFYCGNCQVLYE